MKTVHLTRVDNNTNDGTESIHGWCAMLFSFSWLDTDGYPRACRDHKSCRVCAQSVRCHIPWYASCLACSVLQTIPQPTRWNRALQATCWATTQKKLGLEQHFRAIDFLPWADMWSSCWHSFQVLTIAMYSLLGSIRAISNVSSSTAYCILKIWHIAHFNSTHWLASHYLFIQTSSVFFPHLWYWKNEMKLQLKLKNEKKSKRAHEKR